MQLLHRLHTHTGHPVGLQEIEMGARFVLTKDQFLAANVWFVRQDDVLPRFQCGGDHLGYLYGYKGV